MPFENRDIRLVNGDVANATGAVKGFLKSTGFTLIKVESSEESAVIEAANPQESLLRLFLSASPQITNISVKMESDEQVRITTGFSLFWKFRVFYFSILCSLLLLFGFFLRAGMKGQAAASTDSFLGSMILAFIGASFLVLALFFLGRLLSTGPYENFLESLYAHMAESGFSGAVVLQSGYNFPDFWKVTFTFLALVIYFVADKDFLTPGPIALSPENIFFLFLFVVIGVLVALGLVMFFKREVLPRMLFCLVGIALCLPISIYGNAPALNTMMTDLAQKVELAADRVETLSKTSQTGNNLAASWRAMVIGASILLFFWTSIGMILLFLAWNVLRLPISIIRQLDRFYNAHLDSLYLQSLRPEKASRIFSGIITLLWLILGVANVIGLYFALSILEKVMLDTSILNSGLAYSFFEDTRTIFSVALEPFVRQDTAVFYHNYAMLLYTLPIVLMFSIVLIKNFMSFLKASRLLKPSKDFTEVEAKLFERAQDVCAYAKISAPIVKVEKSTLINSRTEYLGFPYFKHILLVTKGALDELSDDELDALLAHEVGHQKKHNLKRKLLCLFSDYTFFGNGFLAIVQNSYQLEKEADAFAVDFLEEKLQNREKAETALTNLLKLKRKRDTAISTKQKYGTGGALSFRGLKDNSYRKEVMEAYNASSNTKRIWTNLVLLFKIYFGNEVISYFHPSTDQRIEWIKE